MRQLRKTFHARGDYFRSYKALSNLKHVFPGGYSKRVCSFTSISFTSGAFRNAVSLYTIVNYIGIMRPVSF